MDDARKPTADMAPQPEAPGVARRNPDVAASRIVVAHADCDIQAQARCLDGVATILPLPCGHQLYLDGRGVLVGSGKTPEGARFSHSCTMEKRVRVLGESLVKLAEQVKAVIESNARLWSRFTDEQDQTRGTLFSIGQRLGNAAQHGAAVERALRELATRKLDGLDH
jgi:hypothetical protein